MGPCATKERALKRNGSVATSILDSQPEDLEA